MTTLGVKTYPEISSQHEAIGKAWEQLEVQKEWVETYIANPKYDEVIFIGSGSSYYQSLSMAATYRKWTGRRANAVPSSDIFLLRDTSVSKLQNILLVGVSRSGESSEVILALESVADLDNWDTCGITCHETSKMAQICECLISPLGKEKSTVMTKSFSSMTFMMQAAIARATGNPEIVQQMGRIAGLSESVIHACDAQVKTFVNGHSFNKTIYLGMGVYFGLAEEACLKLKEMSYVWTESFGTLEFRHGPKSVVDQGTLVCLLLSEQARSYELKVAEEMKAYGATVWIVTARKGDDTAFADLVTEVGGADLSDEARAVLYLPPVQYFGFYTALKLGVDPDEPKNLTQVVKI